MVPEEEDDEFSGSWGDCPSANVGGWGVEGVEGMEGMEGVEGGDWITGDDDWRLLEVGDWMVADGDLILVVRD